MKLLHKSIRTGAELKKIIGLIRLTQIDSKTQVDTAYVTPQSPGHITKVDFVDQYRTSDKLKVAKGVITEEITARKGDVYRGPHPQIPASRSR